MNFRLYQPGDFDALYAIEERCFKPPERFGRRFMRELVGSENSGAWIAEEMGRMAGFAIVEWSTDGGDPIAYLQTIEVDSDYRGRGVAREILRCIEGSAAGAGAMTMWLHVDEANQAAIRLYQSNGYLRQGRKMGYYGGGRAALVYAKDLHMQGV